jgi:hypothetical protein
MRTSLGDQGSQVRVLSPRRRMQTDILAALAASTLSFRPLGLSNRSLYETSGCSPQGWAASL